MHDEETRVRFERFMLPLMKEAYNLARWLMKSEEDAADAVQDSYVKAFRFFGGFRPEENGRAWLLQIVRNTCYTALSARKSSVQGVDAEQEINKIEDPAPGPQANLARKAAVQAVREGIAALPADFREVIVLRELEGLSYKEIAEVTKLPLGTVMSRLSRARDQLQLILREIQEHDRI